MRQPRIRMFAGPNGSGKSTVKDYLPPLSIGAYLNADDLELALKQTQILDLKTYHEQLNAAALLAFLDTKQKKIDQQSIPILGDKAEILSAHQIRFSQADIDSYLAARIVDFIRFEFLRLKISFTFETVMSHISKVEFLKTAKQQGFKTYLYYVATFNPEINIARVKYRVSAGGHAVPEQKIRDRYYRSMNLLMQAVESTDRTFIFDNSSDGERAAFLAEIEQAEILKLNSEIAKFPLWFIDKVLSEF